MVVQARSVAQQQSVTDGGYWAGGDSTLSSPWPDLTSRSQGSRKREREMRWLSADRSSGREDRNRNRQGSACTDLPLGKRAASRARE